MRLFGKEKQMLRIKSAKPSRVVIAMLRDDIIEVNLSLITEDGEQLDLQLPDKVLPKMIQDLTIVYESIHPPLRTVGGRAAGWQGMEN
jgi:hypothetical protein